MKYSLARFWKAVEIVYFKQLILEIKHRTFCIMGQQVFIRSEDNL